MLAGFVFLGLLFLVRTAQSGLQLYFATTAAGLIFVWPPLIAVSFICIGEALVPTFWRYRSFVLWLVMYGMALAVLRFFHIEWTATVEMASYLIALAALIAVLARIRQCKKFCTWAEVIGLVAIKGALMMGMALVMGVGPGSWVWIAYQAFFAMGLFGIAYYVGETTPYLFHRVFVRLHLTFILLASLMILIITGSERREYLSVLRDGSQVSVEAIAHRLAEEIGNSPSLGEVARSAGLRDEITRVWNSRGGWEVLRLSSAGESFEVRVQDGKPVVSQLGAANGTLPGFLIHTLQAGSGRLELFGGQMSLVRHIRNRIAIIFALFTAIVGVATLTIGGVVRSAEKTIDRQSAEIQGTQRQIMETSKLAAIGEVASTVAHEVNNPNGVILSRASYLLTPGGRGGLSEEQLQDMRTIAEQAKRIGNATGRLLMAAHQEGGETRVLAVSRLLEKALDLVRHRLTIGIVVERRIEPAATVLANEDALLQVLINLLDNAIDAMPEGGRLALAGYNTEEQEAVLQVEDSGHGVAPEDLGRIYESFFTTKPSGKGTGLGLAISRRIVKEHGGMIDAQNLPGRGMRFTIRMPSRTAV